MKVPLYALRATFLRARSDPRNLAALRADAENQFTI
jgi:hypothetical protein